MRGALKAHFLGMSQPSSSSITLLLVLLLFSPVLGFCQKPVFAECSGRHVTYEPFDQHFSAKMRVQSAPLNSQGKGVEQFSPQRSRFAVVQKTDFNKPGPWATEIWIRDVQGEKAPLLLSFTDHANGGVEIHWINEKLIYGSVWWGRIVSTDFVFDIDNQSFIYHEMANYGELIQPCD